MIFCLFVSFCSVSRSVLPPKAQSYLDKIPERRLTLPYVIKVALKNAEAYKMLAYQYATADIESQVVGAITDTSLSVDGVYTDDNSVKTNPFSPLRTKQWKYNFGLNKYWSSGTRTSLGWEYENSTSEFDQTFISGFGSGFATDFKQSTAVILLEQNLLKDSFGSSFRNKRRAAKKRGESIQWQTRSDLEKLTLDFILQYYNAWLTQQQVRSIQEQVRRQKKLVRILTKRSRKGAVEKPDLIQVEALLASNQAKLAVTQTSLAKQWEALVISLKLPSEFLEVNPMEVPLDIDNPIPLGVRVCGHKEPQKNANIVVLEKKLEGLDADFKAAKNSSLPDLKLVAGYRGNSIDPRASQTMQNVLAGRDDDGFGRGPSWNMGLKLIWPLSNSEARAERTKKYIEKEQVASELRTAVDTLKVEWRDLCRRLRVEKNNDRIFKSVVLEQKKRVKAEGRRFSLGRATVNQLVTAEDDLGLWEYNSQQKEIEVRQLSWQVQKYSGELYKSIKSMVEPLLQGESK